MDSSGSESLPVPSTILLVEDNAVVREALADSLTLEGFRVIQAASASDAVGTLAEGAIDLLVTDATLPEVSGAELIKTARERTPPLPALLISAFPQTNFPDLEGAGFLQKPFRPEHLLIEIRRLLALTGGEEG